MNKNNIAKAVSALLVLLLCVGIIAVIAQFTNGFQEEFKTFYVTYKNENIVSANTKRFFEPDEEHRFDVVYTFEFADENEEPQDYNVKIVSNVEKGNEFIFTVDGETKKYTDGIDLTKAFNIKKYDTYFTLNISTEMDLQAILQSQYVNQTVVAPSENDLDSLYLYTLVVSSYDESVIYNIDFSFKTEAPSIEINPDKVVF